MRSSIIPHSTLYFAIMMHRARGADLFTFAHFPEMSQFSGPVDLDNTSKPASIKWRLAGYGQRSVGKDRLELPTQSPRLTVQKCAKVTSFAASAMGYLSQSSAFEK
jgi:hypothetical protein